MTRIILREDCRLGSRWDILTVSEEIALALMSRKFAYDGTDYQIAKLKKAGHKLNDRSQSAA